MSPSAHCRRRRPAPTTAISSSRASASGRVLTVCVNRNGSAMRQQMKRVEHEILLVGRQHLDRLVVEDQHPRIEAHDAVDRPRKLQVQARLGDPIERPPEAGHDRALRLIDGKQGRRGDDECEDDRGPARPPLAAAPLLTTSRGRPPVPVRIGWQRQGPRRLAATAGRRDRGGLPHDDVLTGAARRDDQLFASGSARAQRSPTTATSPRSFGIGRKGPRLRSNGVRLPACDRLRRGRSRARRGERRRWPGRVRAVPLSPARPPPG